MAQADDCSCVYSTPVFANPPYARPLFTMSKSVQLLAVLLIGLLPLGARAMVPEPGAADRRQWVAWAGRIATPVLEAGATGQLRQKLPVAPGTEARAPFATLEAVSRLLSGLAPWLESDCAVPAEEAALRARLRALAVQTVTAMVDSSSPDKVDFHAGPQILVDSAFLAEAFLRAPHQLWGALPPATKERWLAELHTTRDYKPGPSNWLLFAATIEAFFAQQGTDWDSMRVDYALRQHEAWYKGDGFYGDGAEFHFDYYNSIVMHPMLLDILAAVGTKQDWAQQKFPERMLARAQRHAAAQERLISPEGTLPPVGRSLAYRCGVMHGLAQLAWLGKLPSPLVPAQVRGGMTAVMHRLLDAPGTFDDHGWLRIGFVGAQPAIGENYISTGSLYLCAAAFLPLGLPTDDSFWSGPATPWTSRRVYDGENVPRDQALKQP